MDLSREDRLVSKTIKPMACPVCLLIYDYSQKIPKLLKCGHLLCKVCLESLRGQPSCPICRETLRVSSHDVSSFPTVFGLNEFIKTDDFEKGVTCPSHSFQDKLLCRTCKEEFCPLCDTTHSTVLNSTEVKHDVVSPSIIIKQKFDQCIATLEAENRDVHLAKERMDQHVARIKSNINRTFDELFDLINVRRQEELTKLEKNKKMEYEDPHGVLEYIKSEKIRVESEYGKFIHKRDAGEIIKVLDMLDDEMKVISCHLRQARRDSFFKFRLSQRDLSEIKQILTYSIGRFDRTSLVPSFCEARITKCYAGVWASAKIIVHNNAGLVKRWMDDEGPLATLEAVSNKTRIPVFIIGASDPTYGVHFIVPEPGAYRLYVTIFGCPIKTYPLEFEATTYKKPFPVNLLGNLVPSIVSNVQNERFSKLTVRTPSPNIILSEWAVRMKTDEYTPKLFYCDSFDSEGIGMKTHCATLQYTRKTAWICSSNGFGSQVRALRVHGMISLPFEQDSQLPLQVSCIACVYSDTEKYHLWDHSGIESNFSQRISTIYKTVISLVEIDLYSKSDVLRGEREDRDGETSLKLLRVNQEGRVFEPNFKVHSVDGEVDQCSSTTSDANRGMQRTLAMRKAILPISQSGKVDPTHITGMNHDSASETRNQDHTSGKSDGKPDFGQYCRTLWLGGGDGKILLFRVLEDVMKGAKSLCTEGQVPGRIMQILYHERKVFALLTTNQFCIFSKLDERGLWDLSRYNLLTLTEVIGKKNGTSTILPENVEETSARTSSIEENFNISCMVAVNTSIWFGYRGSIFILDCKTLKIVGEIHVTSGDDDQVITLAASGGGVFCSTQLDPRIYTYSTKAPFKCYKVHDVATMVKHLLEYDTSASLRITAMGANFHHLWIGTAGGIILRIPIEYYDYETLGSKEERRIRWNPDGNFPSWAPVCHSWNAMLSLYRHTGPVKSLLLRDNLIMSVGEGFTNMTLNSPPNKTEDNRVHFAIWEGHIISSKEIRISTT